MLVTIIARHLCTVNRNAIVLLTLHQKYHGLKLLYQRRPYGTALVLSDSEAKAEEHFKEYDMSSVRIAAEDEIYHYRSKGCPVVEF